MKTAGGDSGECGDCGGNTESAVDDATNRQAMIAWCEIVDVISGFQGALSYFSASFERN